MFSDFNLPLLYTGDFNLPLLCEDPELQIFSFQKANTTNVVGYFLSVTLKLFSVIKVGNHTVNMGKISICTYKMMIFENNILERRF